MMQIRRWESLVLRTLRRMHDERKQKQRAGKAISGEGDDVIDWSRLGRCRSMLHAMSSL